jgi:hypothetical protein
MMTLGAKRAARICLMMLAVLIGVGVAPVGGLVPAALAGMRLDIETELQLLREGHAQLHIGKARYRFAVFTFDDPDGTGLGNAVASVLSHDLLMNSKVSSIGVLRYEGGLGKASDERQLRYFDKVEPLIESQGVEVAIWGTTASHSSRQRCCAALSASRSGCLQRWAGGSWFIASHRTACWRSG